MINMKKIIVFVIVFFLLSLAYHPSQGEEEKVQVVTHIYGMGGNVSCAINVSRERAANIMNELKNLEGAIKNGDTYRALKIASTLKKEGVFRGNVIFDLIRDYGSRDMSSYGNLGLSDANFTLKNTMCFVVGYGDALFAYPMDLLAIFLIVLLLGWMPLGIILVLAYSALWMYFSHLIPVRFILPITLIGINKGGITTMGLKGVQKIEGRENKSVSGMLIGFSGIVVNIFLLPKNDREMSAPFFCLGTSIMAYAVNERCRLNSP